MRKSAILLLLLAAAACGSGGSTYSTGAVSPLALQPPPIYSLFGYRETLGLSSEQVESLDSIAQAVKARNDPVVDSLRTIADARGGRSRGIIPIDEVTRPMLERVGESNREAARQVQDVLTDAQEERVCELTNQRRLDRSRDRRNREMREERERVVASDSALFEPLLGGWPWCGGA